ncbi:MAG: alpha-1,2-fucosyltransferase [Phycisphaerales bacterium JB043]
MGKTSEQRPRVIVQILGGLGNQMFCYAAARRLAIVHDAQLVLDTTSRLINDPYRRRFMLDRFRIEGEKLPLSEGCHRGWRKARRSIMRRVARRSGGMTGRYLFELGRGFVPEMLNVKIDGFVNLDGLWQDPRYFADVEETIREDFRLSMDVHQDARQVGDRMAEEENSVSVHLRSYGEIPHENTPMRMEHFFLERALKRVREVIETPRLYVFTDNEDWARKQLEQVDVERATIVGVNDGRGDDGAVLDMWLMSRCRAHVISNSTFSWWGAWLNPNPEKLVVGPHSGLPGNPEAFPDDWVRV